MANRHGVTIDDKSTDDKRGNLDGCPDMGERGTLGSLVTNCHIIDNQSKTVAEYLKQALANADEFSFVSAYFTIYGYELLKAELDKVVNVRFLFGDPSSAEELDPGKEDPKSFELTERGLEPNHVLKQKPLARQCAQWVAQDKVAIYSVSRANFLHGKMYLTRSPLGTTSMVGSSNFTKRGLGGSNLRNLEINLATENTETAGELLAWFNRLWNDRYLTKDVKQQVLEALERLGRDYAPQAIYYKMLYELFRESIETRLADDDSCTTAGFQDSQIWETLYKFQQDGAKSVIAKLREHNGCILADSVGLGKTYTALAVIKYFELRNERVLLLCPRKLLENWSLYPAYKNHKQNPFPKDRFAYTLLAHTDLSRDTGRSGDFDLRNFNWCNYDLVVIDESHNFRNDGGQRYRRLLNEVIKAGSKTKVLMLSATPVNTSLIDLRNQINLMTEGREDSFSTSLNVNNIRATIGVAQQQFKEWEQSQHYNKPRNKEALLSNLGADFLRLLDGISISRSRRQIEQFYSDDMKDIGPFPKRDQPINQYPPTDLQGKLSYEDLAEQINEFSLAIYQPSKYVTERTRQQEPRNRRKKQNFNQEDSERFLVGMMRTNFLKRLESSPHALKLTLKRIIETIDRLLKKIDCYNMKTGGSHKSLSTTSQQGHLLEDIDQPISHMPDDDDEDDDFFVNRGRKPYRLQELDLERWHNALLQDRATLSDALARVEQVTPERDGKLQQIKEAVRKKVQNPTHNRDNQPNHKLLVFTTFKDTALYLYDQLKELSEELAIEMAMVSGDERRTTSGGKDFNTILTNFAPHGRKGNSDHSNIDLLIATDCISEGQNLQDCDTVINYDIHWNPVRLLQRFGRIDRIGSRSQFVTMVNYWPTKDMDIYLRLQNRVQARMALADLAASGDEDPFTEDDAQLELQFRDAQLLKLKDEILDLEDLEGGPVIGDFTLDYFFTQLLRYLERNKSMLEAMASGAYAVTSSDPYKKDIQPGVIFFLRQRNARNLDNRHQTASPVHPFYLVYLYEDGTIRHGCSNVRQTIAVFEAAAAGKAAPISKLCHRFDYETHQGQDMSPYEEQLEQAIKHIQTAYQRVQSAQLRAGGGRRDFLIPKASEMPLAAKDFELITWLVIRSAT